MLAKGQVTYKILRKRSRDLARQLLVASVVSYAIKTNSTQVREDAASYPFLHLAQSLLYFASHFSHRWFFPHTHSLWDDSVPPPHTHSCLVQ